MNQTNNETESPKEILNTESIMEKLTAILESPTKEKILTSPQGDMEMKENHESEEEYVEVANKLQKKEPLDEPSLQY